MRVLTTELNHRRHFPSTLELPQRPIPVITATLGMHAPSEAITTAALKKARSLQRAIP